MHSPAWAVTPGASNKVASDEMRKSAEIAMPIKWTSQSMRARVDLADKDAVYAILDDPDVGDPPA